MNTKTTIRTLLAPLLIALGLVLGGCGPKAGEEYVGHWDRVGFSGVYYRIIERAGDGFLVKETGPGANGTLAPRTMEYQAVARDGGLELFYGPIVLRLKLDPKTGQLVGDGAQYVKVK